MGNQALFKNNAFSTLAGAITNSSVTAQLASGGGALFPTPAANQYFAATLTNASTGLLNEIVWVTNVTGDQVTMIRAQEGTAAQNWAAGDLFNLLFTAGGCQKFAQDVQVQSGGYNSATDTGTANAYVVALSPALTAHQFGLPIWWRAANGNTGASTFNDGAGSLPLVNPDGTALGTGTITAGGMYINVYDGLGHQVLVSTSNEALSSQGVATTGATQWRPTTESVAGWLPACGPTATIGNATSGANLRANADTRNLFTWLWTNFSNTQCPVLPSGRGANALADYNANKTIGMIDLRGRVMAGMDNMGGFASSVWTGVPVQSGSTTTPGSVLGENVHTLTVAELPGGITSSGSNSITVASTVGLTGIPVTNAAANVTQTLAGSGGAIAPATTSSSWGGANNLSGTNTIAVSSTNTLGGSHNTAQQSMLGTIYVKM